MTMTRLLLAASTLFCTVVPAHADIFKWVSAEGHVTYSNMGDKHCKRLSLDTPSAAPAAAPSAAGTPAKAAARTPTPQNFPKVDESAQRSRDSDRKRILEGELDTEQKNLEQAKRDLADQEAVRFGNERNYQKVIDRLQPFKDRVALHERNIEAIRAELSRLR